MKIWMKNKVMIDKYNQEFKKEGKNERLGLNEFDDLSKKELDDGMGYHDGNVEREKGSELVMSKEAPVTTQKNQDYGICTIPCICTFCPGPGGPPPGIPK